MFEESRATVSKQLSLEKWQKTFKELGAEWEYRGGDVCALYTLSGKVSDYYFNSDVISRNPEVLGSLCREVYLPEIERRKLSVDLVASYPPYGVAFANALAQQLGVESCLLRSLTSPTLEREVRRHSRVLVVADDIFSGSSVVKTIQAAKANECAVAPVVFAFGNFSGHGTIEGLNIFSVINRRVELLDKSESPLVARGIRPVNARENWQELFVSTKTR